MKSLPYKIGRNQFKCYHCRLVFSQKDGNWFNWDEMQVHLCKKCEKITAKSSPRIHEEAALLYK